ncbi:DNAase [Vibrio sp. 99-70-13A1]|uniref:DNAase n=1 Tax=Vibrio sp. 99-70-13A1 TaxID=2607601 RepID=UPI00149393D5|nr:DNAase [Vibrio sp. 99-70-13A1]NOH96277.1 DNAase [Vibrio sp. 99-70-13A1]
MIELVSDNPNALKRLRVAFRACPKDFDLLKSEVKAGRVSVYELTGDSYRVTVAGEIDGDSYFLWGVSGRGVIPAMRELKVYVKECGLTSISAETYFPLVAKLCRRLSTEETERGEVTRMEMRV